MICQMDCEACELQLPSAKAACGANQAIKHCRTLIVEIVGLKTKIKELEKVELKAVQMAGTEQEDD